MKRMSVVLVVAGLLSVTIPGGAVHAAPESDALDSVVKAIKKQFAKKSSVRFSVKSQAYGRDMAGAVWGEDLVNGINPGFLKLGASHQVTSADGGTFEGVKTTLHSGTVTVPKLGERQAGMYFETREEEFASGGPITWKLWVGPDHLPRRFHAIMRFTRPEGGDAYTMTMNIIYRGWGGPVKITAPPEHLITVGW